MFISNDDYQIVKNEEKYSYSIEFKRPSKSLILSIINTHLILGSTITDNYKTVTFKAITIQTLSEFQKSLEERNNTKMLTHELGLRMVLSLSKQLNYFLTKTKECFFKYDTKNIIVIDEDTFIYVSNDDLMEREKDKEDLIITLPFSTNDYISPELLNIKSIPTKINYKTIYYSLGLLVLNCVSKYDDYEDDDDIKKSIYNKLENSIQKTNLYYFLKRCLNNEIEKRSLIYI